MSANQSGAPTDGTTAPPTSPGPFLPVAKLPVWPTVVGVIAIVFGVLGALGGLAGLLGLAIMRGLQSSLPAGARAMDVVRAWAVWTIPLSLVTAGIALLLLAGGVGLVQRRRWAPRMLRCWALLKMFLVVASSVLSWSMPQAVLQAQTSAMSGLTPGFPSTPPGSTGVETQMSVSRVLEVVLGLLWGWALPVFMLIWLARGTIKTQVAEWGVQPATSPSP
jgi:hypothetical protein